MRSEMCVSFRPMLAGVSPYGLYEDLFALLALILILDLL